MTRPSSRWTHMLSSSKLTALAEVVMPSPFDQLSVRYAIVIERAGDNYSVYVPDLPGCVATGGTPPRRRVKSGRPSSFI